MDNLTRITATNSSNYFHRMLGANVGTVSSAFTNAAKIINGDIAQILETFKYKGGFSSLEEAKAWMNKPMTKQMQKKMIAKAYTLPEPARTQWLIRASAPSYLYRSTVKEALMHNIQMNNAGLKSAVRWRSNQVFGKLAQESYIRNGFEMSKLSGYAITTSQLPKSAVSSMLSKAVPKKYQDYFASEWSQRVHKDLISNVTAGKSIKSITSSINDLAKDQQYRTTRYVRTFMTSVTSEADDKSMEDAGFEHYRYVATLDEVTCPICGSVDNKVFPIKESEAGENSPPMHYNCRCRKVVVFTDEKLKRSTRIARDENGDPIKVPADMDYAEYKEKYLDKTPDVRTLEPEVPKVDAPAPKIETTTPPKPVAPAEAPTEKFRSPFADLEKDDYEQMEGLIKNRIGIDEVVDLDKADFKEMRKTLIAMDKAIYNDPKLFGQMSQLAVFRFSEDMAGAYAYVGVSETLVGNQRMVLHFNSSYWGKGRTDAFKYKKRQEYKLVPIEKCNAPIDWSKTVNPPKEIRLKATATPRGTAMHEFEGHARMGVRMNEIHPLNSALQVSMHEPQAQKLFEEAAKLLRKRNPKYVRMSDYDIRLELSHYSTSSYAETIAEARGDYYTRRRKAHPISLIIRELMQMPIR